MVTIIYGVRGKWVANPDKMVATYVESIRSSCGRFKVDKKEVGRKRSVIDITFAKEKA